MPEEILFEIPEVRITTERIVFSDETFEIGYIASTEVSTRVPRLIACLFFVASGMVALLLFLIFRFVGMWDSIAVGLVVTLMPFVYTLLPKEHVLTLTMTDKMFYEVITRTPEEAKIIQGYVHEAMVRCKETHQP